MSLQKSQFEKDSTSVKLDSFIIQNSKFTKPINRVTETYQQFLIKSFISYFSLSELSELKIRNLPEPLIKWHPALPNTVEKFKGQLSEIIPSLSDVSERNIEKSLLRSRHKE
ncbi:MAG: hypothetical protein OEM77_04525 [Nitrosopumilus sp.]|nr:hypothetical protein [Nitrosopumilus sp.]MDH3736747.1 hypothetical protein [Nitrosopumilus sp.]MDH3823102.1 hypothetical protein [Nitrosopumilus sp.]MDH3834271.1 hypothetical protein [Nitrosopumilus sp.]